MHRSRFMGGTVTLTFVTSSKRNTWVVPVSHRPRPHFPRIQPFMRRWRGIPMRLGTPVSKAGGETGVRGFPPCGSRFACKYVQMHSSAQVILFRYWNTTENAVLAGTRNSYHKIIRENTRNNICDLRENRRITSFILCLRAHDAYAKTSRIAR